MKTLNACSIFFPVVLLSLPAVAQNPYLQPDDTWITISGKVESVSPNQFELDYGSGTVTVEMDDGDRDADAYKIYNGDEVTVTGLIDDDFYEVTTIEASSVHVKDIGTTFYASAVDEEDPLGIYAYPLPELTVVVGASVVTGTVSDVDVAEEEFTLNTGLRLMTVEVDEMPYNPVDDEGYQKLEAGDVVSVRGQIDHDLFEGRVFEADSVTTLSHNIR